MRAQQPGIPFVRWLSYQRYRDDAVGELARACDLGPGWPADASPADLRRRLEEGNASQILLTGLEEAEEGWRAERSRRDRPPR